MTDSQELMRGLGKLGYETYLKDDVVMVVVDPEDYIHGVPKLTADLEKIGWNRSYGYKPSRPLTPEEQAEWERNIDPFPELGASMWKGAASKKRQPGQRSRSSSAYKARMAAERPQGKNQAGSGALPKSSADTEIPGQMDIFQFLGGKA